VDRRCFVRGVIENQMHIEIRGDGGLNAPEKLPKLLRAMPRVAGPDDGPGLHVERGEERGRSVPHVVMRATSRQGRPFATRRFRVRASRRPRITLLRSHAGRHRQHPLPHGHGRQHVVDQVRRALDPASAWLRRGPPKRFARRLHAPAATAGTKAHPEDFNILKGRDRNSCHGRRHRSCSSNARVPMPTSCPLPVVHDWVREIFAVLYILNNRRLRTMFASFQRNPPLRR
jgi:hypothetical protein